MRRSVLYRLLALLQVTAAACIAQQPAVPKNKALVFPFAIAGAPIPSSPPFMMKVCPAGVPALATEDMTDAQKVVSAISQQMLVALSQHNMTAQAAQPDSAVTPGTVVFSGCLTGLKHGSAAARSISIGAGGSQVVTHVRIFTAAPDGAEANAREYDLVTKGTNYGGGLIVGLARAKRTSVEGDGKHAADQIVDRYFSEASTAVKAPSDTATMK